MTIIKNSYLADELSRELFFQFPVFLLKNKNYNSISNDSKIAYMLFKSRLELSLINNWLDDNNSVYVEFTQKELMNNLNCYEGKVKKIIKELIDHELLTKEEQVFDPKTKKKAPNRYYLLKPQLEQADIYFASSKETRQSEVSMSHAKIAPSENVKNTVDAKIAPSEKSSDTNDSTSHAKIAYDLYNNKHLDTNDTNDTQQAQEKLLLDIFVEQADNHVTQGLDKACLQTIATFSDSLAEAEETVGTIIKAKSVVQKKYNINLRFEDWNDKTHQTLRDVFFNLHKKKKREELLKSPQAFIYKSMINHFEQCANQIQLENTPLPEITLSTEYLVK